MVYGGGAAALSMGIGEYRNAISGVKPPLLARMRAMRRLAPLFALVVVVVVVVAACGSDDKEPIGFGAMGPLVGDAGKGSWRFGAASAATQIEDMNPNTDWYVFTQPKSEG